MKRRFQFQSVARLCAVVSLLWGAALPQANAFDQWGDNGSTGAGSGNGSGPGSGPGPDGGPNSGEPVAIYSGQYLQSATDFEIPGRMPLRVKRLYRSGSYYQGMFG